MTLNKTKLFCLFLMALLCPTIQAQIITTFAGNGISGNSGNEGPAINAQLSDPRGICTDSQGNIYVADRANSVVRKIDSEGIITVFAGTGVKGYSGDGATASLASLGFPSGLCSDQNGNIYITDQLYSVIRKVDASGIITTIAGNGYALHMGDGGPALEASFYFPSGICVDPSGNIYFSDTYAMVIRKINAAGIISTFAGTPLNIGYSGDNGPATSALLRGPAGISINEEGDLLIADASAIRKVNTAGIITTIAGGNGVGYSGDGGQAKSAQLGFAISVVAKGGNIYISDISNGTLREINDAGIINTIAGTGNKGYSGDGGLGIDCELNQPEGIYIDMDNNIYITDAGAHVIRKIGGCPSVKFLEQPVDQAICEGSPVVFTVRVNEAIHFKWQTNNGSDWTDLKDDLIYSGSTTSTLSLKAGNEDMKNNLYRCIVSNVCGEIISASAKLIITQPSSPSITISTATDTICQGSLVNFTAILSNGGPNPTFQWAKNGTNTGTNSPFFEDSSSQDGDIITCTLVAGSGCFNHNQVISNSFIIKVNPIKNLSVKITISANEICAGTPVEFKAIVENGGLNPAFQWKKNNMVIQTGTSGWYKDSNINNAEMISLIVKSNESCLAASFAISNEIYVKVNPLLTPSVVIAAGDSGICEGDPVTFTSAVTNSGISPTYQWYKNGSSIGANTISYTDNFLKDDVIFCIINARAACLTSPIANSNTVMVNLLKPPMVTLDKNPAICVNDIRILDAGNFKSYHWNNGSKEKTLSVSQPGIYYVTVTDNNGCKGSDTAKILSILPAPSHFLPGDTSICDFGSITLHAKSNFEKYFWNDFTNTSSITIKKPGNYWLEVTDKNNCTGRESITVSKKDCMAGFYIGTAFSPNKDGKNDLFKPMLFGNVVHYQFAVYDQWGQRIFQTADTTSGWDGTFKKANQLSNVFVWICSFQFEGQAKEIKKGSVILIR